MIVADAQYGNVAIVLRERQVVPLSSWLSEQDPGQELQIVTPSTARLTMPLRLKLSGPDGCWVVRDGNGYYDGLTGAPLVWDGTRFAEDLTAEEDWPAFELPLEDPTGAQVTVIAKVRPADEPGSAVEQLCLGLTGQGPDGFGPVEPVTARWDRSRLGMGAYLVVSRGGAIASMMVSRGPGGYEESITLVAGYSEAAKAPISSLHSMVAAISAGGHITSLLVQMAPGRADLSTEARRTGPSVPLGFAVSGAHNPPGFEPVPAGTATWFALNDGPPGQGWQRYQQLLRSLG